MEKHKIHQTDTEKQASATSKTTEAVNAVNETLQSKATSKDIAKVIDAVKSIPKTEIPKPLKEIDVNLKGVSLVTIKGDKGDKPTKAEILEVVKPLIPKPIPGKDADEEKIIQEILKKIPTPKDGRSPITISKQMPKNPQKGDLWYRD